MGRFTYDVKGVTIPKNATIEEYIRLKLKILRRDFLIKCTDEEIAHVYEQKTEYAVDTACRKIIYDRLGKY